MGRKKWEIPYLTSASDIFSGAQIILTHRLFEALTHTKEFVDTHDPEALHQLRIALRRLRYPLETFTEFLPRKATFRFLQLVNRLQQAAGTARDYDVMIETLQRLEKEDNEHIPENLYRTLEKKRKRLYRDIDKRFKALLNSSSLSDFKIIINYDDRVSQYNEWIRTTTSGKKKIKAEKTGIRGGE